MPFVVGPQITSIPARQVPLRRIAKPCSIDMVSWEVRRVVLREGDRHREEVRISGLQDPGGHSQIMGGLILALAVNVVATSRVVQSDGVHDSKKCKVIDDV